jgi:uncharacterized ion transporter superfamily protein YfcC
MQSLRFPHPLVLLTFFIILAAALSHVLPAGQFARRPNAATGREVVVAGSYQRVPATPVSFFQMLTDLPRGLSESSGVIFLIFLAGGAFTVVDRTGALRFGIDWLLHHAQGREVAIIPLVALFFATLGALENMGEEIIALVPVLLVLVRRLGYPVITAVAASLGAALVGAAFSPINPFQVIIAQKLAQLPLFSAWGYRLVLLALALVIWVGGTLRYAVRHRLAPDAAAQPAATEATTGAGASRHGLVLLLLLVAFSLFGYGVVSLGWEFEQMSALFFGLGVSAGLLGGLGLTGTAEGFVAGFRDMAFSAILIGFARTIFVVLEQGHIVDTIVQGLATPLAHLPVALAAVGMLGLHTALHLPVPSVSGQAVLTMPLLVPLSDLIGLSRQVTVLAYQYGAGITDLLTPTNGALMAMLTACGVRYDQWLRFAGPLFGLLLGLGTAGVLLAIWLGI